MALGKDVLGLLIAVISIWIIFPDPIPIIDELILIPVVGVLILKFSGDM